MTMMMTMTMMIMMLTMLELTHHRLGPEEAGQRGDVPAGPEAGPDHGLHGGGPGDLAGGRHQQRPGQCLGPPVQAEGQSPIVTYLL